jgi:hypothetical protein
MAFVDEKISDRELERLAGTAGYQRQLGGIWSSPEQLAAYEGLKRSSDIATNVIRPTSPEGLGRDALIAKLNEQAMRQVPGQQQQYAIKRQEGLSGTGNLQQIQSMDQRNIATAEALANAKAAPGPGRSLYDQRLQQMMLGSFAPDDPSYKWRLEQGMTNLGRSQAAKGMLGSGNMAAELLSFGQGMASQEYGAQFNRLLQASTNATNQYTAAYSVLDRMLQQQQAQQNVGLQGEQMAQEWARVAQGWGNQNLGIASQDTSRFAATSSAATQAGQLNLARDQFNAQEKRLDNWNAGQGQALTQNAGRLQPQQAPTQQDSGVYSYYTTGPAQAAQPAVGNSLNTGTSSGSGFITNNSTGATTSFGGGGGQNYQSWGNDYGYEAVYGD